MYWFHFLGRKNWRTPSVCQRFIYSNRDRFYRKKAKQSLCTDAACRSTDTDSCGSSSKKGLPGLCSLSPASIIGVLRCTATRTVHCIVLCTVQPLGPLFSKLSGTLLICHCLQCNQCCHQFVAKHTWTSFFTDPGYFVSWGSYNDQTCFHLLDAVISELLTTASAHASTYDQKERWLFATFVVYSVRGMASGYWPLSGPGLFLWKKTLKHCKEFFVSGCVKPG